MQFYSERLMHVWEQKQNKQKPQMYHIDMYSSTLCCIDTLSFMCTTNTGVFLYDDNTTRASQCLLFWGCVYCEWASKLSTRWQQSRPVTWVLRVVNLSHGYQMPVYQLLREKQKGHYNQTCSAGRWGRGLCDEKGGWRVGDTCRSSSAMKKDGAFAFGCM